MGSQPGRLLMDTLGLIGQAAESSIKSNPETVFALTRKSRRFSLSSVRIHLRFPRHRIGGNTGETSDRFLSPEADSLTRRNEIVMRLDVLLSLQR